RLIMPLEGLEKFPAPRHDGRVRTAIHELKQGLRIFPDRHINGKERVRCSADTRRITALILQAPHETGACIRQSVDSVQSSEEVGGAGVALRRHQLANIDLSE